MSVGFKGERHFNEVAYHYCGRCGTRRPIQELQWQLGVLVCSKYNCVDTGVFPLLDGAREAAIIRNLEQPTQEGLPDRKLLEPSINVNDGDDILF